MKYIFTILAFSTFVSLKAQHSLTKLWQTDSALAIPESVHFDAKNELLYVSLIDGNSDEKDGRGGIAKIKTDGTIINANWITGLNAPKGIGVYRDLMYVADLTDVVVIKISESKVVNKIPVEGAQFLNDITVDKNGVVYVSDTRKNRVHRIKDDVVKLFASDVTNANGVLAVDDDLYVLAAGDLLKFDTRNADKGEAMDVGKIARGMDKSTDGIEMVAPNEFIVSCWNGVIYYVKNGTAQQMLDYRAQKINTADIGYDPKNKIVYIPTFFKKSVMAFKLK